MQIRASSNPAMAPGQINEKLRAARLAQGEKVAAVVGLREAATLRLEMLKFALEPVVAGCADARGFIDLALVPGFPARLWIDIVGHVVMEPNPRCYRFQCDCRDGHDILIESEYLAKVVDTIAHYIASSNVSITSTWCFRATSRNPSSKIGNTSCWLPHLARSPGPAQSMPSAPATHADEWRQRPPCNNSKLMILMRKYEVDLDKRASENYPSIPVGILKLLRTAMSRLMFAFTLPVLLASSAMADDVTAYQTTLKGAAFEPAEIHVPAGKPFIIKMTNANSAPAELEAKELDIEKVAAGNSLIVVKVKAMEPGKYLFVDEYQEDVAKGYVIVE